jgi:hypothetical protein
MKNSILRPSERRCELSGMTDLEKMYQNPSIINLGCEIYLCAQDEQEKTA